MSDQEFENYLALIGRLLRLNPSQREAIGQELRDHFELRLAELVGGGLSHEEAVRLAIEEFGDAAGLAAQFSSISQTRKRRLVMRFTVGSVAALAAAIVIAMASWPEQQAGLVMEKAAAQSAESEEGGKEIVVPRDNAARKTEEKLNQPFAASFIETPLRDVLGFVSDHFDVQLFVESNALADLAIDPTTLTIDSELTTRGAKWLELVLGAHDLGYMIDNDGLVIISTKTELENRLTRRVYDCRKILGATPAITGATSKVTTDNAPFGSTSERPATPADKLIGVITETIAPHTWSEQGGPGTICEYGGLLVVSQTQPIHQEVADLLDQLSEKLAVAAK